MTNVWRVDEPNLFDEPGMATTLRVTLLVMLGSALAISALTLFLSWRHTPQLALMSAASCLVALVWSRFGWIRSAMLLPLLSITYAIVHLAARSDGIQNIGLAILPVLIMLGSLVLDRLTLVFFTAAEILAIAGMLAIRYFALHAERYSTNDMGDLFIFALTCATAALVGRLVAVRIENGFRLVHDGESRYRRIFENVQDVYCEMSIDGILLELNPAGAALFGIPREGMIGRPLTAFCENSSELDALREAVRAHGQVSNRELIIRDSGAVLRHVLVNASLQMVPRTGEERVIGSIRDITERKRAEEALRESERTFREVLEGVQFVAVVTAQNGKIIFCNDYALAITGWSKEEVIGRAAKELLDPESLLQGVDQKAIAPPAGRTRPFIEGSILEKNGGRRWIQWSSTSLRDSAGRVAGLASLGEDVTELRALRAEAARLESEERFRDLADTAPALIWVSGPDKLCTFFNKPWLDFTGRTMEQEMGHGWARGVHPDDLDRCLASYSSSFDARRKFQMEYRLQRADGEYRWLLDNGTPLDRDGEFAGFIGSCIDITERKRAEEILKASEEKYRALVETTDTGYLIIDKEGKVIDANREYVRLTGHSELGEILGRSVIEWTAAHEKPRNAEALARCVKDGFIRDLVIDYVDGSKRVTPVEINAKVTGSGESLRIISLCRDVSDRKRAEEVRLQLQLAQAQKMESIGRLAGGVAHDFNNLLTVINGYAALLSKELAGQDPLRRYALEIGEAGKRAASLTSQLLAFSRKRAIMPKAVDVNAVVADAERMLQRLIGEDIELVSSLAPHLELVMADPDQIHQIILNLAVNARDAMPNGGKFEITTAEVELDKTAADAHPDATPGRYVRLTVTDTGTGMTEEVQRKIFEPFFTTKEPGKGTGLGLAMVHGAVRQHDGWIEVNSKLGWGSTFRIHLPCIDAGMAVDEAKLAATNAVHGDETVLVVEDQEAVRRLTKTILEEHGYRVIEAASGAEAHAVARGHAGEIDLLLTDVVMPGMDGRTLSEQLRDLRPNLRVILMSGYAEDLIAHRDALASGLAYIQKPFRPEELATKVRGVLDSRD